MTSSGIKRGVAASAISALAVAGLPFFAGTANAVPLDEQVDVLTILTQGVTEANANANGDNSLYPVTASFINDGTNETVSLVAAAPTAITTVLFQYSTDDGVTWKDINTTLARNADGAFQTDWAKPADVDAGDTIDLRAVANTGAIARDDVAIEPTSGFSIEMGTEGNLGIYANPHDGNGYVAVRGTTNEPNPNSVVVSDIAQAVDGDATPASVTLDSVEGEDGISRFVGVLDYIGNDYNYDTGTDANQTALAGAYGNTDDVEASSYYVQNPANFTVTATPADNTLSDGQSTEVTVTVTDSTGAPVAGVDVGYLFDAEGDAGNDGQPDTPTDNADGTTDGNGETTFTITDPAGAGTADGTYTAYADTSAPAGYNAADVEAAPFAINGFDQSLTAVDIVNERNRSNFDTDELQDGDDFTIETQDQEGDPFDEGVTPQYRWILDPTAAGEDTVTGEWVDAGEGTSTTDGVYTVDGPSENALDGIDDADLMDGTWTLEARRPNNLGTGLMNAAPEAVSVSESEITFDDGESANAQVEGEFTATGTLANDAGGLGGREVTLTYSPAGDSRVAPQNEQPAGVTVVGNTATVITDANGDFAVKLEDPAGPAVVPDVEEEGSTLNALGTAEAANDTDPVDLQDNYGPDDSETASAPDNAEADLTVNFVTPTDVTDIDIDVTEILDGQFGPGRPVDVEVEVNGDEDGDPNTAPTSMQDYPVTISVDKGFLSPYAGGGADNLDLAEGHDEEGDLWGFFENQGPSSDTSTGDAAQAQTAVAIERDAGFDDDGLVDVTITVTAGDVTETETVTADSRNPINVASADLVRDADEPAGDVEVGDEVDFNFDVLDQFGNLAGDEDAQVTDDSTVADFETEDDGDMIRSDYTTSGASLTAFSNGETVQTLMAMWTAREYLVEDVEDLDAGNRNVTADSDPIVWVKGGKIDIEATLSGRNSGAETDKLKVVTDPRNAAGGATVNLFKFNKNGVRVLVESTELNRHGVKRFQVKDRNGRKFTKYVAKVKRTADTKADRSNKHRVR